MTCLTQSIPRSIPATHSLKWFKMGWQLMLNAPFKLFGILLLPLIFEGIMQTLPAPYGIIMSKWLMAFLAAAIWPLLHHLATKGDFSVASIVAVQGWSRMPVVAVVLMLPAAMQLWFAQLLLGSDGIGLLLYAQQVEVTQLQLGLIFASATPIMLVLFFIPARILLANVSVAAAITQSVMAVVRGWRPLAVLGLVYLSVLICVPFTFLLSALLTGPWLACVGYFAYCELFELHEITE